MSATKICPQCGREESLEVRFCPVDGTALRLQGAAESDLVGQVVADRYHVLRKLGEGGMGTVYLVEHVKMQRKSALKVMNPGMVKDSDAISRFNREAANASRINHPNVASVYDFGETSEGLIFLAMEFVDGPPLTNIIEQQGALAPARAAEMIRQAADALAVAHDMGIVHRDLKPDNIMVAKTRDGGDLVKVVDFGIAKAQDSSAQKVTKTGLVVGTPEYMSPEQLSGDKLDGRSDIYSLGLVAYNMMTGKLPFPSDSQQESMIMRLTDRPKPLVDMKADVSWPPEVQAVMDRVLERDMKARYQSAPEFARDLVRAVEAMPTTAAMEAGTVVMSAAGLAGALAGAPAAAIPATRVASKAEVASTAPAPVAAAKSKTPMYIGVAAALLIAAGFGAKQAGLLGKQDTVPPAGVPDVKAGESTKVATDTANKSPAVPTAPPVGQRAAGSPPAGTRGTSPPATPGLDEGSMSDTLETLDGISNGSMTNQIARRVALAVQGLRPSIRSDSLLVRAAMVEAQAEMARGDTVAACGQLKLVERKVAATKYKNTFSALIGVCPPS